MVRGAVWGEMFLLLFGDVAFLGFGWLLLILGSCARASHTPAPLERGGSECLFLIGNEWFIVLEFPSREGIEGCVTEGGAVWAEVFLLLFGEEVFLGFGWLLWI